MGLMALAPRLPMPGKLRGQLGSPLIQRRGPILRGAPHRPLVGHPATAATQSDHVTDNDPDVDQYENTTHAASSMMGMGLAPPDSGWSAGLMPLGSRREAGPV
jgi:hypothetical protein